MAGATGLDYPAVKLIADANGIDFEDVLPLVQTLEAERLNYWANEREKQESKEKAKARR